MLGLGDLSAFAAYVLCILSAILCIVYGILNWNKGGDVSLDIAEEEARWVVQKQKIENER